MSISAQDCLERIKSEFKSKTEKCRKYQAEAARYLPGGDTRNRAFYKPYPFTVDEAHGYTITDLDGNQYIDLLNNFSSLIHGHTYKPIVEAVERQMNKSASSGCFDPIHEKLAKEICERSDALELVRFCNSGTEATMFAMRSARCVTGKDGFIRIDGAYNGSHDFVGVNETPDFKATGMPGRVLDPGIPEKVGELIYPVPFNNLEAIETVLKADADKIAGIILEPTPFAGGLIPPKPGYLRGVRSLCDKYGILMVMDEVVTFRLNYGGYHVLEGVKPDIVAMGKIIGGGFPVGAFGGRRDILDINNPANDKPAVGHSGTFSGNAVTIAAGFAAMENYRAADIERLNALGDRLSAGLTAMLKDVGVEGTVAHNGSLMGLAFMQPGAENIRDLMLNYFPTMPAMDALQLALINRGVYIANRGAIVLSTVMDEALIDSVIPKFGEAVEQIKPIINACRAGK